MKYLALIAILFCSVAQAATVTITASDPVSVNAMISSATNGDTVVFAGQTITGKIAFKTGPTYTGTVVGKTGTSEAFISLPGTGINAYRLKAKANCGLLLASSGLANSNITYCDFQCGDNGTYFHKIILQVFGLMKDSTFDYNNVHDSKLSDRDFDIHDCNNVSISHNTFARMHYGGHIDGKLVNLRVVGNDSSHYDKMAWEIQDNHGDEPGRSGDGVLVDSNVVHDWDDPTDTYRFGISFPLNNTDNVVGSNNYVSLNTTKAPPSGGDLGWAYEFASRNGGKFVNNTSVGSGTPGGEWKEHFNTSQPNTVSSGNKAYGKPAWYIWGTENDGRHPSWADDGTSTKQGQPLPLSSAPPPPNGATTQPAIKVTESPAAPYAPGQSVSITVQGGSSVEIDLEGDGAPALATGLSNKTYTVTIPASATAANVLKVLVDGQEQKRYAIVTVTPPPADDPVTSVIPVGGYQVIHKSGRVELIKAN